MFKADEMHRIYVMAAPCSGKSTFATNGIYKGVRLVDFNVHFEQWARDSNIDLIEFSRKSLEEREKVYNESNIAYLEEQVDPVCMLGVIGPKNPRAYPDISFVIVQPPTSRAMTYCLKRKWSLLKKQQKSIWSKWSNIIEYRQKLASYSQVNGIPIYPSFEKALNSILEGR